MFYLNDILKLHIHNRRLLGIFVGALLVRCIIFGVVLWNGMDTHLTTDGRGYLQLAENLLEHGVFSRTVEGETLVHDSNRTPTYPLFIAVFNFLGGGMAIVLFIQIVISSLSCVLTSKLAMNLFPDNWFAWWSGLFLAFDIPSVINANLILTETLFTFLILSSLFLIFQQRQKNIFLFGIAGLLIGAGILCRPIGVLLPFVLLAFGNRIGWKPTTVLCLSAVLMVMPWVVRNNVIFGRPFISSISEINLLLHTGASIRAERENKSTVDIQQEVMLELESAHKWKGDESDIVPFLDYCRTEGWKEIQTSPQIFAKQSLMAFVSFMMKPERGFIEQLMGNNSIKNKALTGRSKMDSNSAFDRFIHESNRITVATVLVQVVIHFVFLICCLFSLIYFLKNRNWRIILLLIMIVYLGLGASITEVSARFRVPAMPYIYLLAVAGIPILQQCYAKRKDAVSLGS